MQASTLKTIIGLLSNVVSKDATRHHLTHLKIERVIIDDKFNHSYKFTATDGHILACHNITDESLSGLQETYINVDMLDYLKSVLKQFKHSIPNCLASEYSLTIDSKVVSHPPSDVKYPNTQQLFPKYNETVKIGLDAELLLDLVKGLKDPASKRMHCSMEFSIETLKNAQGCVTGYKVGNTSPFIIKCAGSDAIGLLMPVRV